MAKSNRTTKARPIGKRSSSKQPPVQKQANQPVEPVRLPAEFIDLNALNSIETQAGRLNDPRLQTVQRQALTRSIGQRQGNRHLQQVLATTRANRPARSAAPVQRFWVDQRTEQQKIQEAIQDQSVLDVLSIRNFQAATPHERLQLLDIVLTASLVPNREGILFQLWQGIKGDLPGMSAEARVALINKLIKIPWNITIYRGYMLREVWASFGNTPDQMNTLLADPEYLKLWQKSDDAGADLSELNIVEQLKTQFERDIRTLTLSYLSQNLQHIEQEMDRLGLQDPDTDYEYIQREMAAMGMPYEAPALNAENGAELKATQKVAGAVATAQEAQQALREIPVGYTYSAGNWGPGHASLARFDPDQKPPYTSHPFGIKRDEEKLASWEELKKSYDELSDLITSLSDKYPAVFAILQSGGKMKDMAEGDPHQARQMIAKALAQVRTNVNETFPKIGDDISVYDLEPIHAQLMSGVPSNSGIQWNQPFFKWVAQDAKSDHESREFWVSLGLGTLAAAAFVFSSLATGGTAAFLFAGGLAAGGAQAAMSWERYLDLAQAAKTNVKSDLAIVTQGQVNAALVSAILDTAFALLDVYAPAKAGIKAGYRLLRGGTEVVGEMARAGAKVGTHSLETLAALRAAGGLEAVSTTAISQAEKQAVLEQVITEFGVEEAVRHSGKSVDELIMIVGPDSAAGKQLAYHHAWADSLYNADELAERAGKIKAGESFGNLEDDRIMMQLINQQGPINTLHAGGGWKHLSNLLEADALAAKRLYAWREQIWQDLDGFVFAELSGDVSRVMPSGQMGETLAIEFLGEGAVENLNKARSYLAGRLGVDPGQVEDLLNVTLSANPNISLAPRLSAADDLTEATPWSSFDDEVTEVSSRTTSDFGDEATDVSGRAAGDSWDEVGETTKVIDEKQLDELKFLSRDETLDFTRPPRRAAKKIPEKRINKWRQGGVKHRLFVSATELTEFCQRIFKRPIEPFEHVYFHTDWKEFSKVARRLDPKGDPRRVAGFYEPDTGFIHISPNATDMRTVLHESVHRIAHELTPNIRVRLGAFLDEGLTEWIARSRMGTRVARHGYDPNVQMVETLARHLGTETMEHVLIHGDFERFWKALVRLFDDKAEEAYDFIQLLDKASNHGLVVDQVALGQARKILDDVVQAGDAFDNEVTGRWAKASSDFDNEVTGQWRKTGDDFDNEVTGQWRKTGDDFDNEATGVKARAGSESTEQTGREAIEPTQKIDLTPPADFPTPGTVLAQGDNYDIVHSVYIDAARQGAPYEFEVGLYRRAKPDGSYEYITVQGHKGGVRGPGDEWETVAHFHPGAITEPGFRNPAPQDLAVTMDDFIRRGGLGSDKEAVEMVHSQAPDGSIVTVEFGVDPKRTDAPFFVRPQDSGERIYFVSLYPKEIEAAMKQANAIADPDERMRALIQVLRSVDSQKYYAGWWANGFSPAMTAPTTP